MTRAEWLELAVAGSDSGPEPGPSLSPSPACKGYVDLIAEIIRMGQLAPAYMDQNAWA
jgi:hypothetical protein